MFSLLRRGASAAGLLALIATATTAFTTTSAFANGYNEPPIPAIGTRTVATADLLVTRPPTTPCVVTILDNQEFAGFDAIPIAYVPPASCPGPWAKVVMQADFSVTAGVQYDRTGIINIGGVNVYFGTTMEPGSSTARAWHVERDVTDYTATLLSTQSGQAILGNQVDGTYTGVIYGTVSLAFYPASASVPVMPSPEWVQPLAPSTVDLSPTTPQLNATFTFPTNVERLYLDVIAQSQNNDEFWYTCVPDAYAAVLQSCPGGSFREVEVLIDGTPAGVAPIFPWIYSGGISPYLWFPTPGVQTLNFAPYRVDLTPFAGALDDGKPHTVSVTVTDAQDHFTVSGTLMAWQDTAAATVTGGVTSNTLTLPVVNVDASKLVVSGSNAHGPLTVSSSRSFVVSGSVNTSHGKVSTSVAQSISFSNTQRFVINAAKYQQNITQATDLQSTTTTNSPYGTSTKTFASHYPLTVDFGETASGNDILLNTAISQTLKYKSHNVNVIGQVSDTTFEDSVTPSNLTTYDQSTGGSSVSNSQSMQHYTMKQTGNGCYDRTIVVTANAVSAVNDGCSH